MKQGLAFLAAALLFTFNAAASTKIDSIEVTQNGNHYFMDVKTTLHYSQKTIWETLSNPVNFEKLNNSIQAVVLYPPVKKQSYLRVFSKIQACVAIFCVAPKVYMDFYDRSVADQNQLSAVAVAKKSTFKSMTANWVVSAVSPKQSKLNFTVNVTPDFWVPPLIGPWLIKRKMHEEALETLAEIEKLISNNG